MKKPILTIFFILSLSPPTSFPNQQLFPPTSNTKMSITIVPLAQMSSPAYLSTYLNDQKTKGYSLNESDQMKQAIKEMMNTSKATFLKDPYKSEVSNIPLAFNYKGIPFVNPIGYAPRGRYIPNRGWPAIITIFNDNEIGPCVFSLHTTQFKTGNTIIPKEAVRYDINHKITTVDVQGSKRVGFMYNVM